MNGLAFKPKNAPTKSCRGILRGVLKDAERDELAALLVAWGRRGLFYYLSANWLRKETIERKGAFTRSVTTYTPKIEPPEPFVFRRGGWSVRLSVDPGWPGAIPYDRQPFYLAIREILLNVGCREVVREWQDAIENAPVLDRLLG